ncbi:MAG: hypothetical protein LBQ02_00910 [Candidatus Nomurabacteria bacterium]|nr:hypothetical protein [Candidatus Nomurabacteria bacterium]
MENTPTPPVMPLPASPQPPVMPISPNPIAPTQPTPIGMVPPTAPPPKKKSKLPLILIIAGAVLILGSVGVLAVLSMQKNQTAEIPLPEPEPEPTPTNTTLICTANNAYVELPEYVATGANSYDIRMTIRFDTNDELIDFNNKGILTFKDYATAMNYYNTILSQTEQTRTVSIDNRQITIIQAVKALDMTSENAASFGVPGIAVSEDGKIIKDKASIKTAIGEQGYRCN